MPTVTLVSPVYLTQVQRTVATGAEITTSVRQLVTQGKTSSTVNRQPKERRHRHTAYSCSVTAARRYSLHYVGIAYTNGVPRIITTISGVSNNPGYGGGISPLSPDISVHTRHQNLAELSMYKNLHDSKVELLTVLAELRKTSEGVLKPLNQLYNAARAARRGRWKTVLQRLGIKNHRWRAQARHAGDRWLEISFGWLPLLGDIQGLIDLANEGLLSKPMQLLVRGKSTERIRNRADSSAGVTHFLKVRGQKGVRCSMLVKLKTAHWEALGKTGFKAPQGTLWEIAPWSFAIDYVTPIGDWLTALSAPVGFVFITGSRTSFAKGTCIETREENTLTSNRAVTQKASCTYDIAWMNRAIYTAFPNPSLGLKNPLSSLSRGANIAALLSQQLRELKKLSTKR